MDRLKGKTCFVTGAAQGIGRAITEQFLAEGAAVIGADLRFGEMPSHPALTCVVMDACDPAAVAAAAAAHPEVSVLVNCVGYVVNGSLLDCALEDFDRSITINVRSMMIVTGAFLPAMIARKAGSIVNIASIVSSIKSAPNRFAYGTSKAAVLGLTMSVARDYLEHGIRCNAISPGTVETPSLQERILATGDEVAGRKAFVARQPMGRLATSDEIAGSAVLLASDEASYMTGTNIIIDGGWSL
ncbi:SDR family oxidoreductase [Novosphingobium sp. BL-52-GroH]|uniref:SDR family oxidoreductase n=1 Tax=Novosphingobium sp. BL-52-GroH TaxID=3349877 RepID=UPI00384FF9A8